MRTFAAISAGGILGLFALKFVMGMLMPILALVMGLFVTAVKLVLIGAAIYFVYSLFFKNRRERREAA